MLQCARCRALVACDLLLVLPWMMHASMKPPLGDLRGCSKGRAMISVLDFGFEIFSHLSSMNGRNCCMKAGPHDVMASISFCR